MRAPAHIGRPDLLCIELLGGFRVAVSGGAIPEECWRSRKAATLVKLLALAPDHRLHREQVIDVLWPEMGLAAGANNLRYTLHVLRRVLAPTPAPAGRYLRTRGSMITLGTEASLWVDIDDFESAVVTARRSGDPADYESALRLYRGDLLPTDCFEEWAIARRVALRDLYVAAVLELAQRSDERGESGAALEARLQSVAAEDANEQAHRALMRLYARSGRRQLALRQYQQLAEVLRREIGVEPDQPSRRLYEQIREGRFDDDGAEEACAPRATRDIPRSNLPAPLNSFVGREREIAEVMALFGSTRLLTLTGVGGCGKTRLALRIAGDSVNQYADGVWLVELAGLTNPALVPNAVAAALNVREVADQPIVETLCEAVRSRRLVLVLDNCEHVLGACATLANALLRARPDLTLLVTSRERLGLTGEVVWLVPSLSLPTSGERLIESDAVRLFVERAAAVAPGFRLTPANGSAVVEICRGLDGLPLALELAAARVPALSVEQIAARLDDRFRLLIRGDPTAQNRQQTLQAALDWSYELLADSERALFRRLSVFAGGFDLEAAEYVGRGEAAGQSGPAEDVLEDLTRLVEKSLVAADTRGGLPRYRLLETVRHYAGDRLIAANEDAAARQRHRDWFLSLARRAAPRLEGQPDTGAWLDRLDSEHDNFRDALTWSLEHGDTEAELRLAGALLQFWQIRGRATEARRWLEGGLRADTRGVPAKVLAGALQAAADLAQDQGDFAAARAFLEESLPTWRELGDRTGIATALSTFANLEFQSGDYVAAKRLFDESLLLSREIGEHRITAYNLNFLGLVAQIAGDYAGARVLYEESAALCADAGDTPLLIQARNSLGMLAYDEGDYTTARACYEANLPLVDELGYAYGRALTVSNLGHLARKEGDYSTARSLLEEALRIAIDVGSRRGIAWFLSSLGMVAAAAGQMQRAARLFGADAALRNVFSGPPIPYYREDQEQAMSALCSALDKHVLDALWAEGAAMSADEAIAYAFASSAD